MKKRSIIISVILIFTCVLAINEQQEEKKNPYYNQGDNSKLSLSDGQWRKVLTPTVYHIMREKGTETAGTGPYVHNYKKGTYYCAACGHALFSGDTKFDSHTGWPSFYRPLNKGSVMQAKDNSYGMDRDEVLCARCGGHLGHVFDDGPAPTGLRYCMNGYALNFVEGK